MNGKVVALLLLIAISASVQANFAAAPGFSGRTADCTSCHQPAVQGDDAVVAIAGIPESWAPGQRYDWTVSVANGPATIPGGPQAGFEAEVLAGSFSPGPDADGDVRTFHPKQVTYTEDGVRQRAWSVSWHAPDLSTYPQAVTVWVAGLAANGNHNTQVNASDLGEHGDSVDTTSYIIPPAEATLETWRALPLAPPVIESVRGSEGRYTINGRLGDSNASAIEIHDGQRWQSRLVGPAWQVKVQAEGDVRLRSTGLERSSDVLVITLGDGTIRDEATLVQDEATPAPLVLIPLLLALFARRTR